MPEFCYACGGEHESDTDEIWVDFKGYRFHKPFYCMCCGKEICTRQFAFGRACGACDVGACDIHNRAYNLPAAHPHPKWWDANPKTYFDKFVEAVNASPIKEEAL